MDIFILTVIWRAVILLHPGIELPFNFEITDRDDKRTIVFMNGEERIVADEIKKEGDTLIIKMPVFDSEIRVKISDGNSKMVKMNGFFINHSRTSNNIFPFSAEADNPVRFESNNHVAKVDFTGKWETHFSPKTPDSSDAIGQFVQKRNLITGTFLTPTGDYRYLEGNVVDSTMNLSCFDGVHLFLFKAKMKPDGTIDGEYWSGSHWHEPWIGKQNNHFKLPDADTIMHLLPGYDNFTFSFPNDDSTMINFPSDKYKNKVTIIQIMGTWCPNCMDETSFLSPFYSKNKSRGLEIIGLAFEKTPDFNKAKSNIKRLKDHYKIEYPVLIAGTNNKDSSHKKLPMIDPIYSYPTTIFIDKKGKVRRIHTGYSGPATGNYYDKWLDDFNAFIDKLLNE